jgi:hypothetical protein
MASQYKLWVLGSMLAQWQPIDQHDGAADCWRHQAAVSWRIVNRSNAVNAGAIVHFSRSKVSLASEHLRWHHFNSLDPSAGESVQDEEILRRASPNREANCDSTPFFYNL